MKPRQPLTIIPIIQPARNMGKRFMQAVFGGKAPQVSGDLNSAIATANAGLQLVRLIEAVGVERIEWHLDPEVAGQTAASRLNATTALNLAMSNLMAAANNHLPDNSARRMALDALAHDAPLSDVIPVTEGDRP